MRPLPALSAKASTALATVALGPRTSAAAQPTITPLLASTPSALNAGLRQYVDAAAPPATPPLDGETIHLSATARLLTLADPASKHGEAAPTPPRILASLGAPALASGGIRLAEALRLTLEESGLFYESHLREWVTGERAESVVLREAARRTAEGQHHIHMGHLKQQVGLLIYPAIDLTLTHVGGRFDLSISRESTPHQGATAASPAWHIRVETQLPNLGRLIMQIAITTDTLTLVAKHQSAEVVQSAWPRLASRLREAGFTLASTRWEYLHP